jgi:hypothetical protein
LEIGLDLNKSVTSEPDTDACEMEQLPPLMGCYKFSWEENPGVLIRLLAPDPGFKIEGRGCFTGQKVPMDNGLLLVTVMTRHYQTSMLIPTILKSEIILLQHLNQ